ncbi:FMN-binding protein [Actinophytocola sp.]|uniref:FMN-binding protein n=1 Tax=Actinophytocola sp. TaxID=1872138 RepID=UPI002ED3AAF7
MKRAIPIMILTVAGLIPLWRFEPTPETTSTANESTQSPSTSTDGNTQVVAGSTVTTRYGDVQVEVTFSGTEITSVRMLQQPDSGPTSKAVPELIEETLTAQSADVASVSGATTTSEAYVDSLQAAIDGRDQ